MLWERAGEEPTEIQILRRRWIGHTLRKPANSITRQALCLNPQEEEEEGSPKELLEKGCGV